MSPLWYKDFQMWELVKWWRSTENCNRGIRYFPPVSPRRSSDSRQGGLSLDCRDAEVSGLSPLYKLLSRYFKSNLCQFHCFKAQSNSKWNPSFFRLFTASSARQERPHWSHRGGQRLICVWGRQMELCKRRLFTFKRTYFDIQHGINVQFYEVTLGDN